MENHLHHLDLIRRAVDEVFEDFNSQYSFTQNMDNEFIDSYDLVHVAINKNDLVIYATISRREGYGLFLKESIDDVWKSWSLGYFVDKIFPMFSLEKKNYLRAIEEQRASFDKYSFEWYRVKVGIDLKFLCEFYPEMIKNGKLEV